MAARSRPTGISGSSCGRRPPNLGSKRREPRRAVRLPRAQTKALAVFASVAKAAGPVCTVRLHGKHRAQTQGRQTSAPVAAGGARVRESEAGARGAKDGLSVGCREWGRSLAWRTQGGVSVEITDLRPWKILVW